jgi:hypothetical protein
VPAHPTKSLAGEAVLEGTEPAFDEAIAPGASRWRPLHVVAACFDGLPEAGGEATVAIHEDGLRPHLRQETAGGINELPGDAQHPCLIGVLGHAENPHAAGILMDGGQDQDHAYGGPEADVHLGEIDGDGVGTMLRDGGRPGPGRAAPRGGGNAGALEHAAHGAGAHGDTEFFQFADDAAMAPSIVAGLVLLGQSDDERGGVDRYRGTATAFGPFLRISDQIPRPEAKVSQVARMA